jgi:hypothetical protein
MKSQQQKSPPGAARPTRTKHTKEIGGKELVPYPTNMVRVARASNPKTFIVTLTTVNGLEMSFSLTGQQLNALGEANTSWTDMDFAHF